MKKIRNKIQVIIVCVASIISSLPIYPNVSQASEMQNQFIQEQGTDETVDEHEYQLSETKKAQTLDEDNRDEQGLLYVLNENNQTASIGNGLVSAYSKTADQRENKNSIIIPEKVVKDDVVYDVKKISTRAFYMCTVSSITVSDVVEYIGDYAFCGSMEYVYIGKSVQTLSSYAFHYMEQGIQVKVNEENTNYCNKDGILYNTAITELYYAPPKMQTEEKTYFIPEGVTKINSYAFYKSSFLYVILPDSLKTIGDQAFCSSRIKGIDLKHVTSVAIQAFDSCHYLKWIRMSKEKCTYAKPFKNCDNLEYVFIEKNVSSTSSEMFARSYFLRMVIYEQGTTAISKSAFSYCKRLKTVILPDTITTIRANSFQECSALKKIYIPPSVTVIDGTAFSGCDIQIYGEKGSVAESFAMEQGLSFVEETHDSDLSSTVIAENGYVKIEGNYCETCGYGKEINCSYLSEGNEKEIIDSGSSIYDFQYEKTMAIQELDSSSQDSQGLTYSFCDDTAIVNSSDDSVSVDRIVIPRQVRRKGKLYWVTEIKRNAFLENIRASVIVLPDTVQTISDQAFKDSAVKYLYIGENVNAIAENALQNTNKLCYVYVSKANAGYESQEGVLCDKESGKALCELAVSQTTELPTEVPTATPEAIITPTPEATVTPTPEVVITPTPEVEITPTPETTITPTPETTITPTPEATITPTPEVEITPTPEAIITPTPEATVTPTPEVVITPTPEVVITPTPEATITPTPEATITPTPEVEITPTPEVVITPTPEATITPTPETTITPTPEVEITPMPTATITPTPEATIIPTPEATITPTPTAMITPTPEVEITSMPEATITPTPEVEITPTPTATITPTPEVEITSMPEATITPTPEVEITPTPTATITPTPEATITPTSTSSHEDDDSVNQENEEENLQFSGFQLSTKGNNKIQIKWKSQDSIEKYVIYRCEKNKKEKRIAVLEKGSKQYIDNKVSIGKKYQYRIVAISIFGEEIQSGEKSIKLTGMTIPKLTVKKKSYQGIRYLRIKISNLSGQKIQLYVKKDNKNYNMVKLKDTTVNGKNKILKISYVDLGHQLGLKVRSFQKMKKRTVYSGFSDEIHVKI